MILVDTSAWIDFFKDRPTAAETVSLLLEENQVAICGPILTEIYRGLATEREKQTVLPLFEGCRMLVQPSDLWEEAGAIGFLVSRKKQKVKTMDLLICCYALAHQVPLLTLDSDFKKIVRAGVPLDLFDMRKGA